MSEQHFVFVHGACHGGWCWYKVANSLRASGHKATCIDLNGAGINQTDPNTVSSLDDYDQPLNDFLCQLPVDEKVILVSHSVGGGSMTASMCLFPSKVSMAVYVAAAMVKPGTEVSPELKEVLKICSGLIEEEAGKLWDFTFGNGQQNLPTSMIMKPEYVRDKFYNESPMEDYTLATTLLCPAPVMAFAGIMDIPEAPEIEKIPRVYMKTGNDHLFKPFLQDLMVDLCVLIMSSFFQIVITLRFSPNLNFSINSSFKQPHLSLPDSSIYPSLELLFCNTTYIKMDHIHIYHDMRHRERILQ